MKQLLAKRLEASMGAAAPGKMQVGIFARADNTRLSAHFHCRELPAHEAQFNQESCREEGHRLREKHEKNCKKTVENGRMRCKVLILKT